MYYLEKNCPVCQEGILGLLTCSDGEKVVIMCDECDSVWLSPEEVAIQEPIYPTPPDFFLPNSKISVSGGHSGWAQRDAIREAGMENYISEERKYTP